MKTVSVRNTKEAIDRIRPHLVGRKIRIRDIRKGQNINPEGGWITRKLSKEVAPCYECLHETGYDQPLNLRAFTDFGASEFRKPVRLEKCKAVLQNTPSTITLETDDATIQMAFVEGCCGGMGRSVETERTHGPTHSGKPVGEVENDEGKKPVPIVTVDSEVVPVALCTKNLIGLPGGSTHWNTTEIWGEWIGKHKMYEAALRSVAYQGEEQTDGETTIYRKGLWLVYPPQTVEGNVVTPKIALDLGIPTDGEKLFWIDVTQNGETTRYKVEDGFKPLLFDL